MTPVAQANTTMKQQAIETFSFSFSSQMFVGFEQARRFVLPGQFALDALAADGSHVNALVLVTEQRHDLCARSATSLGRAYQDASPPTPPFGQVELHDRAWPSAMYSMILFIVERSFISFARSGFTQMSAVLSISSSSASVRGP
jgi:hypothetical protein